MLFYIFLALCGLSLVSAVKTYRGFRRNLAAAKQSGLPYICVPVYTFNIVWLITHTLWLPLLHRLPSTWTDSWIAFIEPNFIWSQQFESFRKVNADCFILVSPWSNSMYAADAAAISQITTRRNDFPKPLEMYGNLNIFGTNVVTTEGANWRHHRKITSPPFTEKNNKMVWMESLHQGQSLVSGIVGPDGKDAGKPVWDLASRAMRLSLHVISRAGFGVRLNWPHEEVDTKIPAGHTMTYTTALSELLENIISIFIFPVWLLEKSPIKYHNLAAESFREWGQYMREIYDAKRAEVKNASASDDGMDLMGALVKGAGITTEMLNEEKKPGEAMKQMLSDDEILGNAFVFILAGHETAANTLHFAMMYLAMRPNSQKNLQDDLDSILGDKPVDDWSFEQDLPKLFGGMCGAVMNEELRLIPPVVGIPKSTTALKPEGLVLSSGKHVTIPAGCYITLNTVAMHRNPKNWPHTSEEDLTSFRPERWLLDPASGKPADEVADDEEDFDNGAGPDKRGDTAPSLFKPAKGAYIPFSDGYRSCLGRRFAQIEILAVLAVVFKYWSVELDTTMFLRDGEDVATMKPERKQEVFNQANARAEDLVKNGMSTKITLQMHGGKVPLKFVRRGEEQLRF